MYQMTFFTSNCIRKKGIWISGGQAFFVYGAKDLGSHPNMIAEIGHLLLPTCDMTEITVIQSKIIYHRHPTLQNTMSAINVPFDCRDDTGSMDLYGMVGNTFVFLLDIQSNNNIVGLSVHRTGATAVGLRRKRSEFQCGSRCYFITCNIIYQIGYSCYTRIWLKQRKAT